MLQEAKASLPHCSAQGTLRDQKKAGKPTKGNTCLVRLETGLERQGAWLRKYMSERHTPGMQHARKRMTLAPFQSNQRLVLMLATSMGGMPAAPAASIQALEGQATLSAHIHGGIPLALLGAGSAAPLKTHTGQGAHCPPAQAGTGSAAPLLSVPSTGTARQTGRRPAAAASAAAPARTACCSPLARTACKVDGQKQRGPLWYHTHGMPFMCA